MSIENEENRVISILNNIKQEKFDIELDSTFTHNPLSSSTINTNVTSNTEAKMNTERKVRKPRANTVEVKLNKAVSPAKPAARSARSKSPRPKSRSQSKSRKSLPSNSASSSSKPKSASPARTRSKRATATNLGAKLYTKKDAPVAASAVSTEQAQREKSPARSPRKSPARTTPVKAASPAKRTTRSASSAAAVAAVVSTTAFESANSSAYELRRRSPRVEARSASSSRSGTVQAQRRALQFWKCPFTCPFSNWFGSGYLNFTMRTFAHLVVATLLLIAALIVLNRYNLFGLEWCKWMKELSASVNGFINNFFKNVVDRISGVFGRK